MVPAKQIEKIAHWIKNSASNDDQEQFKHLMSCLRSFAKNLNPATTNQETYSVPLTQPFERAQDISQLATTKSQKYKDMLKLSMKSVQAAEQSGKAPSTMTTYKAYFKGSPPRTAPAQTRREERTKEPFATIGTANLSMTTSRAAYGRPQTARYKPEESTINVEVQKRGALTARPIMQHTAPIGTTIPAMNNAELKNWNIQPTVISVKVERKGNRAGEFKATTTYSNNFVAWNTAQQKPIDKQEKTQPFASWTSNMGPEGYKTEYGNSFQGNTRPKVQFESKRSAWE